MSQIFTSKEEVIVRNPESLYFVSYGGTVFLDSMEIIRP